MNTALIILGLLLAYTAGFFCAIKSVQLGLKWNIQTQQGKQPELNPVKPFIDAVQNKQADKANQYTSEVLKEWLNGA